MVMVLDRGSAKNKHPTQPDNMTKHDATERPLRDVATLPNKISKNLVQFFKLLSDETRLRILFFLMQQEELHVRALCDLLGQSQPAVSHHLALMRVAGLIESRRDGKHNYYRILRQRMHELLEMIFTVAPRQAGGIRFEDHELSYTPVDD